ncbi:MAG: hypothetical protein ACLQU2_17695 [Candidatus Binataceae bacterium]
MSSVEELEATDAVFKLVPLQERFIPRGQKFPIGKIFEPSSGDKEDARLRNTNVRLTAWDLAISSFQQAKIIWGRRGRVVVYGLGVVDVLQLRDFCKRERLRIVRDPLPESAGDGHKGHCGFEGLDRQEGENRLIWRTLLDGLAQRCFELGQLED